MNDQIKCMAEKDKRELFKSMILNRPVLRDKIKERFQVNGFYNIKKHGRDSIINSVNETERVLHEVMKEMLGQMVHDLVNI